MLKNHFPMRVVAFDADGIQRNVANIHDIVELAKEKADRYADEESKRFVAEVTNFLTPITVTGKADKAEEVETNNEGDTAGGEGTEKVDEAKVATAKAPAAKKPAAAPVKKSGTKAGGKKK